MSQTVNERVGDLPVRKTYSVTEAANVIGVHRDTVYRLIERGKLRALKSLRHKLIPVTEIERFLAEE